MLTTGIAVTTRFFGSSLSELFSLHAKVVKRMSVQAIQLHRPMYRMVAQWQRCVKCLTSIQRRCTLRMQGIDGQGVAPLTSSWLSSDRMGVSRYRACGRAWEHAHTWPYRLVAFQTPRILLVNTREPRSSRAIRSGALAQASAFNAHPMITLASPLRSSCRQSSARRSPRVVTSTTACRRPISPMVPLISSIRLCRVCASWRFSRGTRL